MKREFWRAAARSWLVIVASVALLAGSAWADPVGTASMFQFLSQRMGVATGEQQTVFLSTDQIAFRADYFDPNPACEGVAPVLAQLFLFTAEGQFIQESALSNGVGLVGTAKHRGVFTVVAPMPPGSYAATFLVRNCTNTTSIVLLPFLVFRVVAP